MGASWSNQDGGETKPKGKPKRAAAKKNRPKAKSDIFDNFTFENESQEEGEGEGEEDDLDDAVDDVEYEPPRENVELLIEDKKEYPSSMRKRAVPKNRTKGVRFSKAKKSKKNYY